jgi:RNA polymerase sigma factor (sigma-70 family)
VSIQKRISPFGPGWNQKVEGQILGQVRADGPTQGERRANMNDRADLWKLLISRIEEGYPQAEDDMYRRGVASLEKYLVQQGESARQAMEIAHDAFSEARLKLHRYRPSVPFGAFIRGFARIRRIVDHRPRGETGADLKRFPSPQQSPLQTELGCEAQETIARALENLPLAMRETMTLVVNEGLDPKEVATRLEVPPERVYERLGDARKRLRSTLSRYFTGLRERQQGVRNPRKRTLLAANEEVLRDRRL